MKARSYRYRKLTVWEFFLWRIVFGAIAVSFGILASVVVLLVFWLIGG